MFFALAKILGFFALPSNLLIVLGLAGVALLATRFARAGRRLSAASILLLAIMGLTPLGNALILPLEQRFPRFVDAGRRRRAQAHRYRHPRVGRPGNLLGEWANFGAVPKPEPGGLRPGRPRCVPAVTCSALYGTFVVRLKL